MRKKVKMDIPQNRKLNLEELTNEEYEILESYTTEILKIKESSPSTSKTKKKTKLQTLKSITSIISVIVFITIISTITFSIIDSLTTKKEPVKKEVVKLNNSIIGSWQSSTNGLFVFQKDNSFYWYNSHEELEDNYYKGTYNYKTGNDALNEMGFTLEEFQKEYGANIKLENIYSINLKPNLVLKNKIDITQVELNQNKIWWYLLIINDNLTANGYNKTLDLKYNLIKTSD